MLNYLAFPAPKSSYNLDLEGLFFISSHDYHVPVIHHHFSDNVPTIIICHSNSEDIGQYNVHELCSLWHTNVIVFDYAGYGLHSSTVSSEELCQKDIKLVYDYLIRKGIKEQDIILYGRSIGTGVVCQFAYHLAKQNIKCKLILISAFRSLMEVFFPFPIFGYYPYNMFNNCQYAPYIKGKVLMIQGCNDEITTLTSAKQLSRYFPNLYGLFVICGGGHHCIHKNRKFFDIINEFLK